MSIGDADLANLVAYLNNIDDDILTAPVPLNVTLSGPGGSVSAPFTVTANFASAVTGFALGDITVTNGSASNLAGSGATYTFTITPVAAGTVGVSLAANVATDGDGDGNFASNTVQVNFNRPPVITQPGTQTTQPGQPASLQIVASDPDGQAITFSATGLPTGLGINTTTGLISGTVSVSAAAVNNVSVTVSDGLLTASASFVWNVPPNNSLPASWTGTDIGAPGLAGSATYSGGVYTLKGGGADIWNTSDQFQYAWRTFTGNGEIIARVTSQTNTNVWAKAGVMFRETLQGNSRHTMMVLTPGNGMAFQSRATTGGSSAHVAAPSNPAPNNWVRLVRNGNTFTGYRSTNGTAWTQVGSVTISMASAINVGVAVTAHNNAALSTATFDNVQVNVATLPAPWTSLDIGAPALTDLERVTGGTYKVSGGGADIYGTSDQFHFTSQTWNGNGQIIARIPAQTNTNAWAKAGIMFRDGTGANARNVAMFLSPSNGFAFQRRTTAGGNTTRTTAASYAAPNNWVRIVRSGNTFTAYRSQNGTTWTQVGSVTVTLPASLRVGLAVTACDNTKISEATFDNVQVKP